MVLASASPEAQTKVASSGDLRTIAQGVWYFAGDSHKGYCNSIVIEMKTYLILVDPSYPGRTEELVGLIASVSPKPVRYVFDTHAHGDHSYANAAWTRRGATTMAFAGVAVEMKLYEPERWQTNGMKREDVRATGETNVELPKKLLHGDHFVLRDGSREVDFLHFGWGHTRGDGFVWLPKERVLCTGDAAVNGPRNKFWDADVVNWPKTLDKALTLQPAVVLPGHGDPGGPEILRGQTKYLRDLYAAVEHEKAAGMTEQQVMAKPITLPADDANWVRDDQGITAGIIYRELEAREACRSPPAHMEVSNGLLRRSKVKTALELTFRGRVVPLSGVGTRAADAESFRCLADSDNAGDLWCEFSD
jgi:glyoxylase-like metal-dependent hydrolase (beta-lactamase superfamily II)